MFQADDRVTSCLHLAGSLAVSLASLQSTLISSKSSFSVSCHVLFGLPTFLLLALGVHSKTLKKLKCTFSNFCWLLALGVYHIGLLPLYSSNWFSLVSWLVDCLIEWRLFNIVARVKFFELTKEACLEIFKVHIEKLLSHLAVNGVVNDASIRSLLFGDYMDPEHFYNEVTDIPELIKTMEQSVK